jgi:hypothetical protein
MNLVFLLPLLRSSTCYNSWSVSLLRIQVLNSICIKTTPHPPNIYVILLGLQPGTQGFVPGLGSNFIAYLILPPAAPAAPGLFEWDLALLFLVSIN